MLRDTIDSLATDFDIPIERRTAGQYVDGVWLPGAYEPLALEFSVITPATGMARVVGGRDMRSDEQGQRVDEVLAIYTNVELRTRETNDPDRILFDGGVWYVVRVERWAINDEVCWRSMITREMRGGS